ncbi:uncharacterized protein EHS24_000861 [Apiotrichum porosum]|uniref:Cyanovirin-N domain-containing protein n=1 Tax=Apiotrichum porosum TaxID=105984 RepID=A0A427YBD0_9TREE|nr:uncharacterized protein EHS24_000861 [Apiotrichum porosum]RSH88324.1 hypothetical protein EHS24_000861 [Apiotrichum porosum]
MKFSLVSLASLLALTSFVAPVEASDWECNHSWKDGGLRRMSFKFNGYCEDLWGRCFLDKLRSRALIIHNWQCWPLGDGNWQVDFSTLKGMGTEAGKAIQDVTGQWKGCWDGV